MSRLSLPLILACRASLRRLVIRRLVADCPMLALLLIVFSLCAGIAPPLLATSQSTARSAGMRTARAFERARKVGSPALQAFFYAMPKGADLHNHLSGAIYAETFIRDAAEDNLCVKVATLTFYKAAAMTRSLPPQPVCGEEGVPAASALTNQNLYDELIDIFSMRIFVPTAAESGHDHFFASFDHFRGLSSGHVSEWLDQGRGTCRGTK